MWSNNQSFPVNFKTLGYTQVQYEREGERDYLLVGNECESWESGHEVCDIFIRGKKNKKMMNETNEWWVGFSFLFEETGDNKKAVERRQKLSLNFTNQTDTQFALLIMAYGMGNINVRICRRFSPSRLSVFPFFANINNLN